MRMGDSKGTRVVRAVFVCVYAFVCVFVCMHQSVHACVCSLSLSDQRSLCVWYVVELECLQKMNDLLSLQWISQELGSLAEALFREKGKRGFSENTTLREERSLHFAFRFVPIPGIDHEVPARACPQALWVILCSRNYRSHDEQPAFVLFFACGFSELWWLFSSMELSLLVVAGRASLPRRSRSRGSSLTCVTGLGPPLFLVVLVPLTVSVVQC